MVGQTGTSGYVIGVRFRLSTGPVWARRRSLSSRPVDTLLATFCSEPSWCRGQAGGCLGRGCHPAGTRGMKAEVGLPPSGTPTHSETSLRMLPVPSSMETVSDAVCVSTVCPAAGPALRTDPPPPFSEALVGTVCQQCCGQGLARPLGTRGRAGRLASSSLGQLGLQPRRAGSHPPRGAGMGPVGPGASRRRRGSAGAAPAPRRVWGPPRTRRQRYRPAGCPAAASGPAACGRWWSGGRGARGTVLGELGSARTLTQPRTRAGL